MPYMNKTLFAAFAALTIAAIGQATARGAQDYERITDPQLKQAFAVVEPSAEDVAVILKGGPAAKEKLDDLLQRTVRQSLNMTLFKEDQEIAKLQKKNKELEERIAALENALKPTEAGNTFVPTTAIGNKAAWRSLKLGMTKDEVKHLLGEPGQIIVDGLLGDRWCYPDVLSADVNFKPDGTVSGWKEP